MQFYYNALDLACKSVVGASREGTKLNIRVFTDRADCILNIRLDGETQTKAYPMKKTSEGFFVCLNLDVGLYWYNFTSEGVTFGRNNTLCAEEWSTENFQHTVYSKDYVCPNTLQGGLIYQIFPDRFKKYGDFSVGSGKIKRLDWGGEPTYRDIDGEVKNNEFFGGNFKGITEKLDYLKSLGVTTIYLNPISMSCSSHRYDAGDYLTPDTVLGTEEDLKKLTKKAQELGITMIFDGVFNHTGADSLYFNKYGNYGEKGAYNDKKSPYYKWYDFSSFPDKYACWWGFENLPSIKKDSKEYQRFIIEKVLPKYVEWGFKGVRLDVVDELTDSFVEKIKVKMKELDSQSVVIGEVWEDATNKIAYGVRRKYFLGKELDSVMNYPLKDAIIDYILHANSDLLVKTMCEQQNNFSKENLNSLMNILSTHDTPRIITVFGRNRVVTDKDLLKYEKLDEYAYEKGKRLAKLAYTITYTCYGVPSLYYGDEVGLNGDLDPYNRRCFPWNNIDEDMLSYMRYLTKVRQECDAIRYGEFKIIYHDRQVLIYERQSQTQKVVVAISRFESAVTLKFNQKFAMFGEKKFKDNFILEPDSALILVDKNRQ